MPREMDTVRLSLEKSHRIDIPKERHRKARHLPCWQVLECPKVLCPAHGKQRSDCWLLARTHCTNRIEEDFFSKLAGCLGCSFFLLHGENHPNGMNFFLSEQLHRYNINALERIYQKEESFVEILNRIPDGLFTTDHEWRITYFNPAAEQITGFSARDAVGMYCRDVFKNSICETDCALKRAVSAGHPIHNCEYEITNVDGEPIPIICSTSAFQDSTGKLTGGLEIFKDISQIKRLQEEVARREKKYRRIFEGSHDMIYSTNQPGEILDINEAGVELMGYASKAEMLQQIRAQNFYRYPEDRERFLQHINREGFVKDFEVPFIRRDGSPIHVLISSRRYENPETGEIEFEGIIKDITQRKQAEEIIKDRNRELSILNKVAVALNNAVELGHILTLTIRDLLRVMQLQQGGIFLIDPEGRIHMPVNIALPEPEIRKPDHVVFKDAMLAHHLVHEKAQLTPKQTFPAFQVRYRCRGGGYSPWMSCFLITSKGRGVGFLGFATPDGRELTLHEMHLLGSLGNFLGGTIENARLMETIRRHRQELRTLTEKLFQSQEEERRRIARELHDEAGQSLTAIKLGLDRLEEKHDVAGSRLHEDIEEIRKMIHRTAAEIRRLSYRLHPTLLVDLGLEPALKFLFKEIERHSGLDIDFSMVGFDHRLDSDIETVLYRFSQEALNNTLKHSGAEAFRLSIIKSYPCIIFIAEDDGTGFDEKIIGKDAQHLGLLGMRERVSMMGGSFHLRSRIGRGTRIRIEVPSPEEA